MNTLDEDPSPANIAPAGEFVPGFPNLNQTLLESKIQRLNSLNIEEQSLHLYIAAPFLTLRNVRRRRQIGGEISRLSESIFAVEKAIYQESHPKPTATILAFPTPEIPHELGSDAIEPPDATDLYYNPAT